MCFEASLGAGRDLAVLDGRGVVRADAGDDRLRHRARGSATGTLEGGPGKDTLSGDGELSGGPDADVLRGSSRDNVLKPERDRTASTVAAERTCR